MDSCSDIYELPPESSNETPTGEETSQNNSVACYFWKSNKCNVGEYVSKYGACVKRYKLTDTILTEWCDGETDEQLNQYIAYVKGKIIDNNEIVIPDVNPKAEDKCEKIVGTKPNRVTFKKDDKNSNDYIFVCKYDVQEVTFFGLTKPTSSANGKYHEYSCGDGKCTQTSNISCVDKGEKSIEN